MAMLTRPRSQNVRTNASSLQLIHNNPDNSIEGKPTRDESDGTNIIENMPVPAPSTPTPPIATVIANLAPPTTTTTTAHPIREPPTSASAISYTTGGNNLKDGASCDVTSNSNSSSSVVSRAADIHHTFNHDRDHLHNSHSTSSPFSNSRKPPTPPHP